jgi:ketosteroid isomerase-like protein
MPHQPTTATTATTATVVATASDEALIRARRAGQTLALARADLDEVARYWTPDVTIRRALGHAVDGAEQARRMLQPSGAGPALIYQRVAVHVEVSAPWPLAWEEGRWTAHVGSAQAEPVMGGRYAAQWVRRDGSWLIRSEVFVALHGQGVGLQAQALP